MTKNGSVDFGAIEKALDKQGFDVDSAPQILVEFVQRYNANVGDWNGSGDDLITAVAEHMAYDAATRQHMDFLEYIGNDKDPSEYIKLGLNGPPGRDEEEPNEFGKGMPGNEGTDLIRDALKDWGSLPGPDSWKEQAGDTPIPQVQEPAGDTPVPKDISDINDPATLIKMGIKEMHGPAET